MQRNALERMTFARVICDNSDVSRVQEDVFELAEFPGDFVSCDDIPSLDLRPWEEDPNGISL